MKKPIVLNKKIRAKVWRYLGSAVSGCHGDQNIYVEDGKSLRQITIPGWDLPPDTVLDVEIKVTVVKLGKKLPAKCENPWPAHRCPTER